MIITQVIDANKYFHNWTDQPVYINAAGLCTKAEAEALPEDHYLLKIRKERPEWYVLEEVP